MEKYDIDLKNENKFFEIKNKINIENPTIITRQYSYGIDDGEESSLSISVDSNNGEILNISCLNKDDAIEDEQYLNLLTINKDLEKRNTSPFFTPSGLDYDEIYGDISDFKVIFSNEKISIILKEGEEVSYFIDGRMTLYYDKNQDLLRIEIKDLTKEEYEALKHKKKEYNAIR